MRKITLYGPMGSGKSTVGKILAQRINSVFVDLDSEVESNAGMSISRLISEHGETEFRNLEALTLQRVCAGDAGVIALGGGSLLRAENRALCEQVGEIVYLDVDTSTLLSRLTKDENSRPLLHGDLETRLSGILTQRREHYESFELRVASWTFQENGKTEQDSGSSKSPEQIAWEIQQKVGRYHVRGMGSGYDVIIEPGGIFQLGQLMKERKLNGPIAVVCDTNVAQFYAEPVMRCLIETGYTAQLLLIPAGEANKTIESVGSLWKGFLSIGMDRKSTVVALGGGVVGDMAGFAAATFMRGCPWVVVPTSLLSMVDASLGGKTGFDLPEGKNLVGAFHSPRLVLADPHVLATLSEEEFRSGLAEVIKHGVISDPELFEECARGYGDVKKDIVSIVRRAMGVKVKVIEQDPYESGIRAALNLGHTVGHAIEIASNFRLRHGEAVAIGMVVEARFAEKIGISNLGISAKIENVLRTVGLPTSIPPDLDSSVILRAMRLDKKKDKNVIKFALPLDIGSVKIGVAVDDLEAVL